MKRTLTLVLTGALAILGLTGCTSASAAPQTTYERIKKDGFITFATEGTYAPYSFHDDSGELVGFDVEVAKGIAEKLGVEAKFTETQWDGIIAGLDANKYDAISNQVSIKEERQQKYLFSDPYTYVYGVVIVNENNNDIKANQPDAGAKIVATSDEATESAILIRKGDDDLQAAINDALSQLRNEGKLKEISEKYFGTDITVPN